MDELKEREAQELSKEEIGVYKACLLYTSPSPRDTR